MSAAVVKLLALAIGAVSYYITLTPPTAPPTSDDRVYAGQLFEKLSLARVISFSSKVRPHEAPHLLQVYSSISLIPQTFVVAMFAGESTVITSIAFPDVIPPDATMRMLCRGTFPNHKTLLSIKPTFVIGFVLLVAGVCTRLWCYNSLGELHTYEVTLRPAHRLVTTGPYAHVRHPSYTAVMMSIVGTLLLHFSHGGWNRQCGIMWTIGGLGWLLYIGLAIFVARSLLKRANVEDKMLKDEFGRDWDTYRGNVCYKFFPGLY